MEDLEAHSSLDQSAMDPSTPRQGYVTRAVARAATRSAKARLNVTNKFCNLPLEILHMIFSYLSFLDLRPLRLASRMLFSQVCVGPLRKRDLRTITTDLSRLHVRQLVRLTRKQALAVEELSICSFSGRPLGLGCRVLQSRPLKLQVPEDLGNALGWLRNCQTLRVSVAGIRTAGYWPAWMGAVDATLMVLEVFCQNDIRLKSIHMDFRTDDTAALLHDGFKHLDIYKDIRSLPFEIRRSPVHDVSLSLNASIAESRELCRRIFSPLWITSLREVSLDLGNSRCKHCIIGFLRSDRCFPRMISGLKLRGATGMSFSEFVEELQCHKYILRILSMENVRFKRCSWVTLLRQLRTEYTSLRELSLAWEVDEDSMFTHVWKWKRKYGNPQFKVTYTGPRKHAVVTALERMACEDPRFIRT